MTERHKVFVSYHHDNDQGYKKSFIDMMATDYIVDKSVGDDDIDDENMKTETIRQKIRDEYIADATVTVVLIGNETWKRKHIDWEISSSLRNTKKNYRTGLIGILLPSYKRPEPGKYTRYTVPPRLWDNVNEENFNGDRFARIYSWEDDPELIQQWIHEAFLRRDKINPINNRPLYGKNHIGQRWYD